MARPRQYGDPISVPFTPGIKERIVKLAENYDVAQVDIIRAAVTPEFLADWESRHAAYANARADRGAGEE